jgi:NTP pyrophosphatase (non-canonical NTP hydrolase)
MKNKIKNLKEYQKLCKRTAKKYTDKDREMLVWGIGIAGEAGDLAGCIKKTVEHTNDQREGIRENIGDVLWYAAMICNVYDWNMDEILAENIAKLKKRHPKGFTEKTARRKGTRVDWNEK